MTAMSGPIGQPPHGQRKPEHADDVNGHRHGDCGQGISMVLQDECGEATIIDMWPCAAKLADLQTGIAM